MKVLLFSKYPRKGASSRLRSFQYLPHLEERGWQFNIRPLFDDDYLESLYSGRGRSRIAIFFHYLHRLFSLTRIFQYQFLWIEKELFPYLPPWVEVLLSSLGVNYIVDYDDAIFHNYDLSSSKLVRLFLGKKIDVVMRHASCVIAGNEYLAQRARSAGARRVVVIPTVVDHRRYQLATERPHKKLTVGWIGSPTTQKYVEQLLPALQDLAYQCDFKLMLVGASADIGTRLPGIDVSIEPWSESSEAELIQRMDIGIMPLEDGPWEKGKCGYKLIQYMATGVPVVASPVGVNSEIVNGARCGLLASHNSEWVSSLLMLIKSKNARRQFGDSGRFAVENRYSIESQLERLEDCFPHQGFL